MQYGPAMSRYPDGLRLHVPMQTGKSTASVREHRHDAKGLVTKQRGSGRPVRIDRFVDQLRGQFAGVQCHEGGTVNLDQPLVAEAPPFGLGQGEEGVGVFQEGVAEAPGPLIGCGGGPGPFIEGASCGTDRGVDVGSVGIGSLGDRLLCGRRDVVVAPPAWLDPLPADVQRVVVDHSQRVRHTGSSLRLSGSTHGLHLSGRDRQSWPPTEL